ncbi:MAG TPA: hypothetical protein VLT13_10215 [Bacteroidota bacterium]|nr:hypothetical protein [Bacteroidota bacterium]
MESTSNKKPTGKKTSWLIGGALLAILAVVYFSFFYPPTPEDEVTGAIGAAKKYRSDQITQGDVTLAGENAASETAVIGANIEAFDRMDVAKKTELVSKATQEARTELFAAFSAENATAILERVPIEALHAVLEKMNSVGRSADFFALMPALDRAKIALKAEAADLNAAYAALDLSAKNGLLEKFSATNKAFVYDRVIASRQEPAENLSVEAKAIKFSKIPAAERMNAFDGMKLAEMHAVLRSLSPDAMAPLAEKMSAVALMKPFFAMPAADQRAIVGRMPVEERMNVYATLPVEAKTLAFKSLPFDAQKAAFDQLPVESKKAVYEMIPMAERTAIEGRLIPVQNRNAAEEKATAVPNE